MKIIPQSHVDHHLTSSGGPSWVLVNRGSIVDLFPWDHALPIATK